MPDLAKERHASIPQTIPLSTDPALVEPAKVQVQMLARQLLPLAAAIKEYERRIEQLFALHRDAALWQSFPGPGRSSLLGSPALLGASAPFTPAPLPSSNTAASLP